MVFFCGSEVGSGFRSATSSSTLCASVGKEAGRSGLATVSLVYIYTLKIDYILQDYAISILYNHIYVIWKSSSGIFLPIITPADVCN